MRDVSSPSTRSRSLTIGSHAPCAAERQDVESADGRRGASQESQHAPRRSFEPARPARPDAPPPPGRTRDPESADANVGTAEASRGDRKSTPGRSRRTRARRDRSRSSRREKLRSQRGAAWPIPEDARRIVDGPCPDAPPGHLLPTTPRPPLPLSSAAPRAPNRRHQRPSGVSTATGGEARRGRETKGRSARRLSLLRPPAGTSIHSAASKGSRG